MWCLWLTTRWPKSFQTFQSTPPFNPLTCGSNIQEGVGLFPAGAEYKYAENHGERRGRLYSVAKRYSL